MSIADMVAALKYAEGRVERLRHTSKHEELYRWEQMYNKLRKTIEATIEKEVG